MLNRFFNFKKYINPDLLINAGKVFSTIGTGLLITETILGLVAIDIAILVAIANASNKQNAIIVIKSFIICFI